ncbi:tyrosine-type recombinase/integrase [Spirosoma agri]|uniref:Tyrosine-type recombinase/integrase n=1 Tax=Spirosoma agri TaxID=1987381 RepID=A0A6M0ICA4_9BACT|nr:tyrosine-type recombinase/integrase [Spirosoma agri]
MSINRTVTFHVARHSFATNLLIYETDVKTVSSLLGHTSLEHTHKYVRVVESLKQNAVNRLLEIDL